MLFNRQTLVLFLAVSQLACCIPTGENAIGQQLSGNLVQALKNLLDYFVGPTVQKEITFNFYEAQNLSYLESLFYQLKSTSMVWSPASVGYLINSLCKNGQTDVMNSTTCNRLEKLNVAYGENMSAYQNPFARIGLSKDNSCIKNKGSVVCLNNLMVYNFKKELQGMQMASFSFDTFKKSLDEDFFFVSEDATKLNAGAVDEINSFVRKTSNGMIPKILDKSDIDNKTGVILTNVIYVNASWRFPFEKEVYMSFANATGKETKYLQSLKFLKYFEDDQLRMVEYPLEDANLTFMVFLPRQKFGRLPYERIQNAAEIFDLINNRYNESNVKLTIPEFKIKSSIDLMPTILDVMEGVRPRLNFKIWANDTSSSVILDLAEVKQEANIELSKSGLQAAAATLFGFSLLSVYNPAEPVMFTCDEPFGFVLGHKTTSTVLFSGVYTGPDSSKPQSSEAIPVEARLIEYPVYVE